MGGGELQKEACAEGYTKRRRGGYNANQWESKYNVGGGIGIEREIKYARMAETKEQNVEEANIIKSYESR